MKTEKKNPSNEALTGMLQSCKINNIGMHTQNCPNHDA